MARQAARTVAQRWVLIPSNSGLISWPLTSDCRADPGRVLIPSNSGLISWPCLRHTPICEIVLIPSNSGLISWLRECGQMAQTLRLNPLEFGADQLALSCG